MDRIEADRAQALADLQTAKATGDYESAGFAVQQIANLDSEARNLATLHSRYQASQQPPVAPEISREERMARPLDKMDYNDALSLAQTSKYGKGLTHDDPNVAAGYAEVQRRRARGE